MPDYINNKMTYFTMSYQSRFLLALLIFTALTSPAHAIRINEVDVRGEPIDYKDDFIVEAKLSGETRNYEAWFYINDYIFARKNVPPDADDIDAKFDLDVDEWELHKINCGIATAKVEIYTMATKQLIISEVYDFQIGNVPVVIFIPSQPTPGKSVRVKLVDADNGNSLKNVDVTIKDVYGGDAINKRTAADGSFTFTPNIAGEYRMSMRENDVCGERELWIKRPLIVDGPYPVEPVVGEMIQVAVPAGSSVGVKIYSADGEVYSTLRSSYNGGANFTINDPGTYTIAFGDLSTKYWSLNKTIEVSGRLRPDVKIAPNNPVVGKPVTITVSSRDSPMANAKVLITKPDGVEREFQTTTFGTLTFEGVTSTGIYEIKATKDRFDPNSASFEARHALQAKFDPEKPTVGETVTLIVSDQLSRPVSDILVEIPQLNERKVTDMNGKLVLNLLEPQQYDFKLSKDLFWDMDLSITPFGKLSVGECAPIVKLGDNVSISVLNSFGQPTEAEILIKEPSGVVKQFTGSLKVYAPTDPGEYSITLRKTNYESANKSFTVDPYTLELSASMSSGKIFINVSHNGEMLPSIGVIAKVRADTFNATTNTDGVAIFSVTREGNVTVTANVGNANRMYAEKKASFRVVRSYDLVLLTGPLLIIFVISLMTIVAVQLGRKYLGNGISLPSSFTGNGKETQKPTVKKSKSQLLGVDDASKKSKLGDM